MKFLRAGAPYIQKRFALIPTRLINLDTLWLQPYYQAWFYFDGPFIGALMPGWDSYNFETKEEAQIWIDRNTRTKEWAINRFNKK